MFGNGDDAGLDVVNIVPQVLMQRKGNGSIYFVLVHVFQWLDYIGMLPCFLAGSASRLVAS